MDIFDTADLTPDTVLSADMTSNIYNGLDSCVRLKFTMFSPRNSSPGPTMSNKPIAPCLINSRP